MDKKRVLLVDDHPKLVTFIKLGLEFRGFEVTTAESGPKGLEAITKNDPHIMVLDIRMPDMDGFEVLRRVRLFSQMPVIVYSATQEHSNRALEHGASYFMAKPFEMDHLTDMINELTSHLENKSG